VLDVAEHQVYNILDDLFVAAIAYTAAAIKGSKTIIS
jgi:hypothetical protein